MTDPALLLGGLFAVLVLVTVGVVTYLMGSFERRDIVRSELPLRDRNTFRTAVFGRLDRVLVRIPWVARLQSLLVQANVRRLRVSEFVTVQVALVVAVAVGLAPLMSNVWAVLLGLIVGAAMVYAVTLLRHRQRAKLISQLPEFARILANCTEAGLSINTALHIAGEELPDPVGREIGHMSRELDLGTPMDVAFERLKDRAPGRDLGVLVSTLVIAHRAGGSLVTSLRGLSTTLDDRKETAREVRTLIAESSYTGYMVAGMGIGLVCLLMLVNDQVLNDLTTTIFGQLAIVVAGISYVVGIVLINRLTRVKL